MEGEGEDDGADCGDDADLEERLRPAGAFAPVGNAAPDEARGHRRDVDGEVRRAGGEGGETEGARGGNRVHEHRLEDDDVERRDDQKPLHSGRA